MEKHFLDGIDAEAREALSPMLEQIAENCDVIHELCVDALNDTDGRGATYAVAARELASLTGWLADTAAHMVGGVACRLKSDASWLLPLRTRACLDERFSVAIRGDTGQEVPQ